MDILVLPGDGIGPEIVAAAIVALGALERRFELGLNLHQEDIGLGRLARDGTTLPATVMAMARDADGILLGPVSTHAYPAPDQGGVNVSAWCRTALDLYANVRPARVRPGVPAHVPALELAQRRRRRLTCVHKANVLRAYSGLFVEEVAKAAKEYPDVELDNVIVDAMAALLVREPDRFDVVVTTNMFGDILSDEAAELAGGLGLAASLNCGADHAVAQAAHGSAPDIAGQDIANPAAFLQSTAMLLEHLGSKTGRDDLAAAADLLMRTTDAMLVAPETRTRDLGGTLGTTDFGAGLAERLLLD